MDCDEIISRIDTSVDELRISSVIDSVLNEFSAPTSSGDDNLAALALLDLASTVDAGTNGETGTLQCGLRDSDWSPIITREALSTPIPQRIGITHASASNRPHPPTSTSIGTNTDDTHRDLVLDWESFRGNDKRTRYYTGLPSFNSLSALHDYVADDATKLQLIGRECGSERSRKRKRSWACKKR